MAEQKECGAFTTVGKYGIISKNMVIEAKKINCVAQCRISSLKQSQGESLEAQESSIRLYVANHGWHIVPNGKVWKTIISGRKTDRADYQEILDYIKSHPGQVQRYIFKAIDRFTRAGASEYERMRNELASYGVEMTDIPGIIQPTQNTMEEHGVEYSWSRQRPSEMTENIEATKAKQEITTILTRMIGQEIRLTRQGYRMRRPPDGFINEKIYVDGKKRPIQTLNPTRARFFVAMFDLRARGGLSDENIVKNVNVMGYTSPIQNRWNKAHSKIIGHSGGIPLTVKQLQRIIANPAYAGFVCERWTNYKPIKTPYPGLVSIDTFNLANRGKLIIRQNADGGFELAVGGKSTGTARLKNNPLYPYKWILCSICSKPLLGSAPRGKSGKHYPKYHCARKHVQFAVPKKDFDLNFEGFVQSLRFKPKILDAVEATFLNKYRERAKEIVQASSHIHQNIADMQTAQAAKIEAIVGSRSAVVKTKLEQEVEELEIRIAEAKHERTIVGISEDDIKFFICEAKKIMAHPAEILLNQASLDSQRHLFGLVFEKTPTYEEILNGTPKLSWIFNVSSAYDTSENQLVTLRGVEPRLQP